MIALLMSIAKVSRGTRMKQSVRLGMGSLVALTLLVGCGKEPKGANSEPSGGESPFDAVGPGDYADPSCLGGASGSGLSGSGVSGVSGACGGVSGQGEEDAGVQGPPCDEVTFTYQGAAESVWVTGSFTGWAETVETGALEMMEVEPDEWQLVHRVMPEGKHSYKLIIDGTRWIADPKNPITEDDTFGARNSVLSVCQPVVSECDFEQFSWRDPVMYFAMVDRFFDSDGKASPVAGVSDGDATSGPSGQYEGGDLVGVTEKLEYLSDLGVSALWLSAPYDNRDIAGAALDPTKDTHTYSGYHGYWPSPENISYAGAAPSPTPKVESRIGTATDLKDLVETAHALEGQDGHGMKVLFDYVMRHVDVESKLYAAHQDWFYEENGTFPLCSSSYFSQADGKNLVGWDHPFYTTHCAFTPYLAPFDFDKAEARAWSVADAVWWAREYGIDGYRLDAIKHVPTSWLNELREGLSSAIDAPEGDRFYLVGETFDYGNRQKLKDFVEPATMLDGQFDFPLKLKLCEALFRPTGDLSALEDFMKGNDTFYGPGAIMSTWIGNHDIPRAIHFASGQITNCAQGSESDPGHPNYNAWTDDYTQPADAAPYERLALAFAVLLTNRGVPLIYYGDEVGLAGGGDPDDRRMMPWNDGALNAHQLALRDKVRALTQIRAQNPLLGRGARTTLSVSPNTWVYQVEGCDAKPLIVAINRADSAQSVTLPTGSYENLVLGGNVAGGEQTLPARSFLIVR